MPAIIKEDFVRTCLYCGQDYLESTSNAEDKESYCSVDHEQYDAFVTEPEGPEDDDEEDEEESVG